MFIICLLLFYISEYGLPHRPIIDPQWYWNIDSALYYIIYYGIVFCSFPLLNSILMENDSRDKKKIKNNMFYAICAWGDTQHWLLSEKIYLEHGRICISWEILS